MAELGAAVVGRDSTLADEDLSREGTLDSSELIEAAFVICLPNEQCTPISTSRTPEESLDRTWSGGCVVSVWDSDLADAWVDENYDHAFLVQIRQRKIGGPIPSMLSVDSAALAIFGTMSVSLIRIAEELANFSGFPVIVRPLEEDPSHFRNHERGFSGYTVADNTEKAGGNAMSGGTERGTSSAQSGSLGCSTHNPADGPEKTGKRQEGDGDSDDDEGEQGGPPPPPPPPPPILGATSKEVVHKTDVTLKLSNNTQDKGHFIRVITKVKLYPPNAKDQRDNHARTKTVYDPSIEGHVYLEVRSSDAINLDSTLGSVGFLADHKNYLQTEHLVQLGYSASPFKVKRITGKQRSTTVGGTLGVAGGKPTAAVNATAGKSTSSTTELADDEFAEQWLVSLQRMDCNWDSEASGYRGLNTMIQRHPVSIGTYPLDIQAKYGITVEVANPVNEVMQQVSFIYRHQIHCWIPVKSKSRFRGLIVLAAHFIPDMRTDQVLWIQRRPTLDLPNMNTRAGSEDNGANSKQDIVVQGKLGVEETDNTSQGTSKDHFVFAAATVPEAKETSWMGRSIGQLSKLSKESRKQETTLPISTLVSHGSKRNVGWDHTNTQWYYPIWPELDSDLGRSSDELRMRWRLDWGDDDGHASETLGASVAKTQDRPELETKKGKGRMSDAQTSVT